MVGRNDENLKGLFEKFLSAEQAKQAVEDIRKGELILQEHPAPEPDDTVIAGIKAEIARAVPAGKANAFRRTAYKAAVAAAAVIILAVGSMRLFEGDSGESGRIVYASIMPRAIWESDGAAVDDVALATLIAEIEQVEDEVLNLQLG